MTAKERYERELTKVGMLATQEPIDYFRGEVGGMWLLVIADGMRRLMEHCLACDGVLLIQED